MTNDKTKKRRRRGRRRGHGGPRYTFTDAPTPLRAWLWLTWNASLALGTAVANLRPAPLTFLVGRIQETELHNERLADWIRMTVVLAIKLFQYCFQNLTELRIAGAADAILEGL